MKTNAGIEIRKQAARYLKLVEWSEADGCFVGVCPELFGGGTHGDDPVQVYAELSAIVEEVLQDRLAAGQALPTPAAAHEYSGKFLLRTGPALHKALAVRAWREGKSLNQVCMESFQQYVS